MAVTLKFYHDAALTSEIDSTTKLAATQDAAGVLGAVDTLIYLGSTAVGMKFQATSSPGVDPVVVSIVDTDAGTGAPASEFKLALSSGGLASAVAGAALALSHTILSGVANAIPIYTRRDSALVVAGNYTDISLETNDVTELPV